MTRQKEKAVATNPGTLKAKATPEKSSGQMAAAVAVLPSFNNAAVVRAYQRNVTGGDIDLIALTAVIRESIDRTRNGDLSTLEAMLVSQATALQSIFTSLAQRAAAQQNLSQYQTFLGLAMKAQAQSRATISALVDLKYPRQATFVKQANIAHGPQQVNNGAGRGSGIARMEEAGTPQNELLEVDIHERTQMDSGTATTPARSDPTMEAVEAVNRAAKPSRKGNRSA